MKKIFIATFICLSSLFSQSQEKYGDRLNIGVGAAYRVGYYGHSFPLTINYEIDVAKNITIAPFISFITYSDYYYWRDHNAIYYSNYSYRTTIIPIGVKGLYYFDELLGADAKWDFYAGLSLGYAIVKTTWEDGYNGPLTVHDYSPVFLDVHVGAEYHLNEKAGLFLDLSSGVSTFGLSIKVK